jgi:NhaP-type Na+/H+ or K+/H+ antiporter
MLFNLAVIILAAMLLYWVFEWLRLPGIIGMIIAGILLGPGTFDVISSSWLQYSGDIRNAALIVILLRAGLGIERKIINNDAGTILKLGTIPALLECSVIVLTTHFMLSMAWFDAVILGVIITSVSPAIIVPQMLELRKRVKNCTLPSLLLAGAMIDNIFILTIFGVLLVFISGAAVDISQILLGLPISIIIGICVGALAGLTLACIFNTFLIRDTRKVIIFIFTAIILAKLNSIPHILPLAGVIGIMMMAFVLLERANVIAHRIADKIGKIWILAEIILFVLIGASINLSSLWQVGIVGVVVIILGLFGRVLGVIISLYGKKYNRSEKVFSVMTFLPKATVQAALGALPLSLGMKSGELILSIAVLSIIITAPVGAMLIKYYGGKLVDNRSV